MPLDNFLSVLDSCNLCPICYNAVSYTHLDVYKRQAHGGLSVFTGVGERTREGNDLYGEMKESGVIDKTALVYGQMNEPPGARMRVALSGLTMAEYFRDVKNQDVLCLLYTSGRRPQRCL